MSNFFGTAGLWAPGAAIMAALIAASGFFSASETALFYLSREDLRRMQAGRSSERVAAALLRDPDRLLTVVLFCNLLINLSYFAVSVVSAKRLLDAGHTASATAFSLAGMAALIFFGEVIPKSAAVRLRRPLAIFAAWPLTATARILDPVLPWLAITTGALRRVFWPQLKLEPYLDVDDLERAVETSELGVELVKLEQQILSRILLLSDITAEEVMRPRNNFRVWTPPVHLEAIRARGAVPEVVLIADDDGDSVAKAIPLYEFNSLPERHLENVAENVAYVPWCATAADTLELLRRDLLSVASVVNEYGETVGIIMEDDLLDMLLNPQSSRARRLLERDPVVVHEDGRVVADGLTTLRYLASRLGVDFEIEEETPLTVIAWLLEHLRRFPRIGDVCHWAGHQLLVIQAGEPGQPVQVRIERRPDRGAILPGEVGDGAGD